MTQDTTKAMEQNIISNGGFEEVIKETGLPFEWEIIKHKQEKIATEVSLDKNVFRSGNQSLCMSGEGRENCWGQAKFVYKATKPDKTYRLKAYYQTEGVKHPFRSVGIEIYWIGFEDEVIYGGISEGSWTKMEKVLKVPPGAKGMEVKLTFRWATGKVWWDDISLDEIPSFKDRIVRISTVRRRPGGPMESNVEEVCKLLDEAGKAGADIVCLPELSAGRDPYPIPGPVTEKYGEKARQYNMYIVAGVAELVNGLQYNVAVLIDRHGKVIGKYRKTHLAPGEPAKMSPGDSYPVFETDFGKVGMIICWDAEFPEPARILALKGAEIIFIPNWGLGDNAELGDVVARARAYDNQVFVVSSSVDWRCCVVDPMGKILAEVESGKSISTVDINLDRKRFLKWAGDFKSLYRWNRRYDTYGPLCLPVGELEHRKPPAAPRDLKASYVGDHSLDLVWQPPQLDPDGEPIIGYEIERDGRIVSRVERPQFKDSNLEDDTTFCYNIYTIDLSGVSSKVPARGKFKTEIDRTPPKVKDINVWSFNPKLMRIVFAESVDKRSATSIDNYEVEDGIDVEQARLTEDGRTVFLNTSEHKEGRSYVLRVKRINDRAKMLNTVAMDEMNYKVKEGFFDDFEMGDAISWQPLGKGQWRVERDELSGSMAYYLKPVEDHQYSIVKIGAIGDFRLSLRARVVFEKSGYWDFGIRFGYKDNKNYYLVNFNSENEDDCNGIFKVVEGNRSKIGKGEAGIIIDDRYHQVELVCNGGEVSVRMDGELKFEAKDEDVIIGEIGVGSFNDPVYFDDIVIEPIGGKTGGKK